MKMDQITYQHQHCRRMQSTTARKDLLSGLVLRQKTEDGITVDEMMSQASLLMYWLAPRTILKDYR